MKAGCTILIAGSSQGIGRDLAEYYAGIGHPVIGFSRGESTFSHSNYRHFQADVGDATQVQQVFSQLAGVSIDVLVYCAGIKASGLAMLMPLKDAEAMLRTSVMGAFIVTRAALRVMKRRGFGRVIYLSSVAVPLADPGSVIYGAGKAAMEQMAFSLSREFARDNITFNSLGLSIYPSRMTGAMSEEVLNATRANLIKPADLQVDELAGAIDYFASDAARQVTGQTLYFGGVR